MLGGDFSPRRLSLSVSVPAMPSLFIKVINSTAVQATWEPSIKLGQHEGFKLFYRKVHLSQYTGPVLLASNITAYNITHLGESGDSFIPVTSRPQVFGCFPTQKRGFCTPQRWCELALCLVSSILCVGLGVVPKYLPPWGDNANEQG